MPEIKEEKKLEFLIACYHYESKLKQVVPFLLLRTKEELKQFLKEEKDNDGDWTNYFYDLSEPVLQNKLYNIVFNMAFATNANFLVFELSNNCIVSLERLKEIYNS